jgi:hypothetical protein
MPPKHRAKSDKIQYVLNEKSAGFDNNPPFVDPAAGMRQSRLERDRAEQFQSEQKAREHALQVERFSSKRLDAATVEKLLMRSVRIRPHYCERCMVGQLCEIKPGAVPGEGGACTLTVFRPNESVLRLVDTLQAIDATRPAAGDVVRAPPFYLITRPNVVIAHVAADDVNELAAHVRAWAAAAKVDLAADDPAGVKITGRHYALDPCVPQYTIVLPDTTCYMQAVFVL